MSGAAKQRPADEHGHEWVVLAEHGVSRHQIELFEKAGRALPLGKAGITAILGLGCGRCESAWLDEARRDEPCRGEPRAWDVQGNPEWPLPEEYTPSDAACYTMLLDGVADEGEDSDGAEAGRSGAGGEPEPEDVSAVRA